jgi:hypothetical protein
VDGKLILEFRVWDTAGSAYVWSRAWTDRYLGCDGLSLKLDDSGQGYGGFYPDITKIRVRNDDRFWDRLTKTAPLLADGGNITLGYTEPYRTGFRGRLVRLIESTSGTERTLFTGAVDDLSTSARGAAEIAVIGLHRLAMEQKGDAEKVDDVTAYGEWTAATGALYRSRVALGNGGYDVECYRHKRVKALFERTKMPRMDASVVAENVKLSTYDARRTVTAVSLPEGLSFVGFVWGDPNADIAYVVGTATGTTKLYSYSYATGEVTLLATIRSALCEVAWSGMFYSAGVGTAGAVAIPIWDTTTGYPWLYVWDIGTGSWTTSIRMDLFAATLTSTGTPSSRLHFDEFLMWTAGRKGTSTHRGTLWFIMDSEDYANGPSGPNGDNRLVEIDPWDVLIWPTVENDSLAKYNGAGSPYALWPAACADKTNMDPVAVPIVPGAITIYIYGNEPQVPDWTGHTRIYKCQLVAGVWQAIVSFHTLYGYTQFGNLAAGATYLFFTCNMAAGNGPQSINSVDLATGATWNQREPEYWPGTGHGVAYTTTRPTPGPQFAYNLRDDRIYYGAGNAVTPTNFNTRLRSLDATSNTTGPRDENCNPAAMTVGDPPTDQASSLQVGTALVVRYKTSATDWELHGVLVSPLEPDVMMTYSKTYYPCVPLFDVRGRTLWQLRQLLAGASYCYFAYDGDGTLRLFQRAGVTSVNPWPAEEPTVDSHGLSEVVNRWSAIPYLVGTSQDTREAEVISQAVGSGSTGCVLNIKTGRVNATVTYRMTFTDATHYLLDKLVTGAWVTACASTPIYITTAFTNADLGISPDCFAGTFVAGDTFTFCVYNSLPVLNQQAAYNKIEVADTASETTWGRTEAKFDNPFLPRAQTIDVLTQVLLWTARPHRAFTLGVVPYRYVGLLEARNLTTARETYSAMAVGWTRKLGNSPSKMLTLLET